MVRTILTGLAALSAIAVAAPLAGQGEPVGQATETNWDGLVRVKAKKLDYVYLAPEADFRRYTKVLIDPTEVSFRKNWQRDQNRDRLDRMMGSAGRMSRLIDDLLMYSRVTTRAKAFAPVDLNAALADALEDLAARVEQTGAAVTAGPMPTLPADPGQIRQVFQNLVGNALKFHRPGVPPVVTVSLVRREFR